MNIYASVMIIGLLIGAGLFFAATVVAVCFSLGEREGICNYGYVGEDEPRDE